jgi:hypothetical protein
MPEQFVDLGYRSDCALGGRERPESLQPSLRFDLDGFAQGSRTIGGHHD